MKTLRVLPEAEEELAQAAEWYEAKRAGLGVELMAIVDAAIYEDDLVAALRSAPGCTGTRGRVRPERAPS